MCDKSHSICTTNFTNNDKVKYSTVLIKGYIVNQCTNESELVLKVNQFPNVGSFNLNFLSNKKGKFKCLVKLISEKNEITINYCNESCKLTIFYEESINNYSIIPLYIICRGHDGKFQSDNADENDITTACKKIDLAIELIQCLYAEKLNESGKHGRKTFRVLQKCIPFHSELALNESRNLQEQELWSYFGREILKSDMGKSQREKFVAFIASTHYEGIINNDYSYENIKRKTRGNAALGGGGLALFGTGCLYTWPTNLEDVMDCFLDRRKIDREILMDDSNYRHTYGGCFSTTLGAVAHEMGHIFDLGHTKDGIMGNGLDYINRVFTTTGTTDNIPDRIVDGYRIQSTKMIRNSDAGYNSNNANGFQQAQMTKLTRIRKQGEFLLKYQQQKDSDITYFTDNCVITLSYHKWFNDSTTCDNICDSRISYNFITKVLTCQNSYLKLVEIRERDNGLLQIFWAFLDAEENSFTIPAPVKCENITLFVIDSIGNILKQDI